MLLGNRRRQPLWVFLQFKKNLNMVKSGMTKAAFTLNLTLRQKRSIFCSIFSGTP